MVAVRTTDTAVVPVPVVGDVPTLDLAHTDTADLLAGVWLPAPPPADLHAGDVVVRLHPPAPDNNADGDYAVTDLEVLAATQGRWKSVRTWQAVDARWPHEIALSVLVHVRYLADDAQTAAQWATLAGPIAAACPRGSSQPGSPVGPRGSPTTTRRPAATDGAPYSTPRSTADLGRGQPPCAEEIAAIADVVVAWAAEAGQTATAEAVTEGAECGRPR